MSQIIIDLDSSREVLLAAADLLQGLAGDVSSDEVELTADDTNGDSVIIPPASQEPDPTQVFGKAANPHVTPAPGDVVTPIPDGAGALTPSVDLDSAGHQWDERIHAGTKTKNANGTWKLRRNVDKELVKQVQAEVPADGGNAPTPAANVTSAPPQSISGAITWPIVLQKITAAQNAGTLNHEVKDAFLASNGITGGLPLLASRPELFSSFLTALGLL